MRRILADVWQLDLLVVEREFTLVGVNPALDEFTQMAGELGVAAEELARDHGRSLSGRRAA
jgi:FMN-dependent NADH-azoreductase